LEFFYRDNTPNWQGNLSNQTGNLNMSQNHHFPGELADQNPQDELRLSFSVPELELGYQQWIMEGMPDLAIHIEIRVNKDKDGDLNFGQSENNP
jgi:hypothetical protein